LHSFITGFIVPSLQTIDIIIFLYNMYLGRRKQMRHKGRSVTGSDEQILTLMVETADVGRIIGKLKLVCIL
jgi:hypothetical protein